MKRNEMKVLGRTGINVSPLCLGTMTFGREADEQTSLAMLDRALDAGVNFIDTANIYGQGRSEAIVGRWLKRHRDRVVLASKVFGQMGDRPNDRGNSRSNILAAVEASLQRLQTDHLDCYYLHQWDPDTALDESLAALETLVQQGKIRYAAISNFSAWQTMKALWTAAGNGYRPVVALQPMYNLLKRQAEVEILPMAQSEQLAVCPYNPMAAGLLTGKYLDGEQGRLAENEMYRKRYGDPGYTDIVARFVAYARERNIFPGTLAVAWVMHHPAVTSTIIGARNMEQLEAVLATTDVELSTAERDQISALSPPPPLATDR